MSREHPRRDADQSIIAMLRQHPGQPVTRQDIITGTGLADSTVTTVGRRLAETPGSQVVKVGNAYTWTGPGNGQQPKPPPEVVGAELEVIGYDRDGGCLARSARTDRIYRLGDV